MHETALGTVARRQLLVETLLHYLHGYQAFPWPGADGLTLEEVPSSYLDAVKVGKVPGREELLHRHPDLSIELEELFHPAS